MLDAPRETVEVKGKPVPTVASGLIDSERQLLQSRGLIDANGRITPQVIAREALDTPEKLLTPELWEAIYGVPKGDVTIEHIQHAFYMAANYGFQILNGNFAAAIDDYELFLRFMNDLATYRIDMSWLWTLVQHQSTITKDGFLKRAALTEDGVVPAKNAEHVRAGIALPPDFSKRSGAITTSGPQSFSLSWIAVANLDVSPLEGWGNHGVAKAPVVFSPIYSAQCARSVCGGCCK